jgi:hypothetical protein
MISRTFPHPHGNIEWISAALMLVIIPFIIFSGCVLSPVDKDASSPTCYAENLSLKHGADLLTPYENCLTPAQKKFPIHFLEFIDTNYPLKKQFFSDNDITYEYHYIPAENASREFGITESTAREHRGEFLVQVDLQQNASVDVIDPFATRVDGKNARDHCVLTWVGRDNLQKIASMPEVKQVWPISRAVYFSTEERATDPKKKIDPNILWKIVYDNDMNKKSSMNSSDITSANTDIVLNFYNNESSFEGYDEVVSVIIHIQPPSSIDVVDPYVTKMGSRDQEFFRIYASVNLTEIKQIASLPEVEGIQYSWPAVVL